MELPSLGKNCQYSDCNMLDFLPAECKYCNRNFCKVHLFASSHRCEGVVKPSIPQPTNQTQVGGFKCSLEGCGRTEAVEMVCIKCQHHFCLEHRYHSCFDVTPSQARRERERAPKEQFKKAKEESDKIVEEKLKSAKNRALANKIKLMRVRGFAQGDNSIPTTDRLFFCVCPPLGSASSVESRPLFVSRTWTVGRCVDSLSKRLKVNNRNVEAESDKVRLFTCEGRLLGPAQDVPVISYLEDCTLIDGDNLILEYIPQKDLDSGISQLTSFDDNRHKYIWTK